MIIQIGTEVDESRILWKHKESDEWKRADIDDLILAYENRPKGEWIDRGDYAVCSRCAGTSWQQMNGVETIPFKSKYCPECGADMRGEDNDN